ncbi:phage holin family protein [Paenirhodobacter enshiensis]|uniref:Holin n=1 Tax=Paenirhodobacter enshiensis TaxID=1105367 RepID=A0A086XQP3_9RHOB|nr:phage holin family protein [Paenirhodobacter enshiensis]KFI24343.1 hypothetical protein CG50_10595 [Paenirhodobacter enshiensis]
MTDPTANGLIASVQALWGAAATSLIAAAAGRLVVHGAEVRAGRRALVGWHLVWELPTAVFMAFVGEAIGSYFDLSREVTTGIVAALSYLGPRGARDAIERALGRGKA